MMRSGTVVSAFSKSLGLRANPELREHLTEMFAAGRATPEALDAIPILAGHLSFEEHKAISRTLSEVESDGLTPKLQQYFADEIEARDAYIAAWNGEGAANDQQTKAGALVSLILGALGIGLSVATGHPEFAFASGGGGVFGATLSTVYGFSRAGVIDENIAAYGVHN